MALQLVVKFKLNLKKKLRRYPSKGVRTKEEERRGRKKFPLS